MRDHLWDEFVIYVNCYSAVAETVDATRRAWIKPAEGLERFCRDANPFVWDARSSFEEEVFEGFSLQFRERFEKGVSTAQDGYAFCQEWLASLEGGVYGTELVKAFLHCASEKAFDEACPAVERQLATRSIRIERTPQDEPHPYVEEPPARTLTGGDIEAVIQLLAKGDDAFAETLRARLAEGDA